jgi:hypothetical protein
MTSSTARIIKRFAALLAAALGVALWVGSPASADDRGDHRKKGKGIVQLPKTGDRCADDPKCHNRWHPAILPAASANSGDIAVFGTCAAVGAFDRL